MIEFQNISKKFKNKQVLCDVNLHIEKGHLVAIIGESGCGKTTMLKMINRLISPTSGTILLKGQDIQTINEVTLRRNIGYVIQQTGLFPHMTVRENIQLIPKLEKMSGEALTQRTEQLMKMVGLSCEDYLDRYPTQLSGGQQQRVGVARAFATDPDVILMDEPFSALDPITRSDLQDELVSLQSNLKKTIVFVTHDMDEAIKIADMICIMCNGKILQYDTPENILKNPADDFVSHFVGRNRIWSSPEFIKISDIMIENPVTTAANVSVFKCLDKMRQRRVDSLMVVEPHSNKLLGVASAHRLREVADKHQDVLTLTNAQVPTLRPDQCILDALKTITEQHISTIPVTDADGRLLGLITKSSLVTTLSQQYFDCGDEVSL